MKNAKHLPQLDRGDQRPISDVQRRAQPIDQTVAQNAIAVHVVRSDGITHETLKGNIYFHQQRHYLRFSRYGMVSAPIELVNIKTNDVQRELFLGHDARYDDIDDFGNRFPVTLKLYDDPRKAAHYLRKLMLDFVGV